jgi:2-polyprenyl-3-methyl-5-hydroxy-6-metoxy-1,4-benzoquinol methylase
MDKSSRHDNIPIHEQVRSWDSWNAAAREHGISPAAAHHAQAVEASIAAFGRTDMTIVDVGCGTGWLCERLQKFGRVTGVDLSDQVLDRARARVPGVTFLSGDLFQIDLPTNSFDVVVTLEVLSHVQDQRAFVGRLASLLKPEGLLIIATQNRPVFERWSAVSGPNPGQIRHWVDAKTLRNLLASRFDQIDIASMFPVGDQGFLRIVNSPKLNSLVGLVVPGRWLESAKERAMLGHTLLAHARRVRGVRQ